MKIDGNLLRNLIRAAFLIAGIAMIVYGATHGEAGRALRSLLKSLMHMF